MVAVLHEDVDAAEVLECARDEVRAAVLLAEVDRTDERLGPDRADLRRDLLEIGLTSRAQDEPRALRGEPERNTPAHP